MALGVFAKHPSSPLTKPTGCPFPAPRLLARAPRTSAAAYTPTSPPLLTRLSSLRPTTPVHPWDQSPDQAADEWTRADEHSSGGVTQTESPCAAAVCPRLRAPVGAASGEKEKLEGYNAEYTETMRTQVVAIHNATCPGGEEEANHSL
uniref:Uncharacterized protein n=1 Tax=Oryza punctata TaxID=4537 RepID=A0A0E0LB80_ORYPU